MRSKQKFGGFAPPDAPVTGAKKKPVAETPQPEPEETAQPETEQKPKGGKD